MIAAKADFDLNYFCNFDLDIFYDSLAIYCETVANPHFSHIFGNMDAVNSSLCDFGNVDLQQGIYLKWLPE